MNGNKKITAPNEVAEKVNLHKKRDKN